MTQRGAFWFKRPESESIVGHIMYRLYTALIIITSLLLHPAYSGQGASSPYVGIDEELGQYVPLDLVFTDENGATMPLKQLIKRPIVLSLIYYNCRHTCPALLVGLAETLDSMDLTPGKDFSILTVSFDETDTPSIAMDMKKNYPHALKKQVHDSSWKFLTGNGENIRKLTESVGFSFKKEDQGFLHPVSLIILSSDGKIIRYLYGTTYLPRDLSMAVYEASQGRPGKTVGNLLLYCFSYDPKGKKYVFNILKVVGTVTIVFLIGFIVYLTLSTKAYRKKRIENAGK